MSTWTSARGARGVRGGDGQLRSPGRRGSPTLARGGRRLHGRRAAARGRAARSNGTETTTAARCCGCCSRAPKPASTRHASLTCTRARSPRISSKRWSPSTIWRGPRKSCRAPPRACPRCRTSSAPGPSASSAASITPTTRRSKACGANCWRATTPTRFMRVADPANISPVEAVIADLGIVGLIGASPHGDGVENEVRLRHADRRLAGARLAHAAHPLEGAAAAAGVGYSRCPMCWARKRARWSSTTATRSANTRWAPGRFD